MKKLLCLLIIIMLSGGIFAQTQKQRPLPVIKYKTNVDLPLTQKERSFIDEVYGNQANRFVYSRGYQLKAIKNILRNRVVLIEFKNDSEDKGYPKLSEVPLFNSFVSTLHRDKSFNPENFNPLKYQFGFYSKGSFTYRVDNTNYFIIIKSQHY